MVWERETEKWRFCWKNRVMPRSRTQSHYEWKPKKAEIRQRSPKLRPWRIWRIKLSTDLTEQSLNENSDARALVFRFQYFYILNKQTKGQQHKINLSMYDVASVSTLTYKYIWKLGKMIKSQLNHRHYHLHCFFLMQRYFKVNVRTYLFHHCYINFFNSLLFSNSSYFKK